MTDELPDIQEYTARLAALYQNSQHPTGQLGFQIDTFNRSLFLTNELEDSWEVL